VKTKICENKNKEIVKEYNNFDSQTHYSDEQITKLNDSIIKNIYDLSR